MRRALWEAMRRQRQAGEPAAPPPEGKTYRRKPGPRPRPESRKPSLPARKKMGKEGRDIGLVPGGKNRRGPLTLSELKWL